MPWARPEIRLTRDPAKKFAVLPDVDHSTGPIVDGHLKRRVRVGSNEFDAFRKTRLARAKHQQVLALQTVMR
jgi:hypothetical protein